jgi:membrane protease YdiL (CAAX protease family)
VLPGVANLLKLFIGTNVLGIWDELFFVITVLAILRRYLPFIWANGAQAILWTSFLYELGFRGWGPVAIFPFALLQGYIFKRTDSLLYILTIHLTIDLVLYLALVHAYHPGWVPLFVTG